MITQGTAARIWTCYREIAAAEKLLGDLESERKANRGDDHPPSLSDAFGRKRQLQLGVPSGEDGHRLFGVPVELAVSVIKAHIAAQRATLVEANEQAKIELNIGTVVTFGKETGP